jgi:hypothetical protein
MQLNSLAHQTATNWKKLLTISPPNLVQHPLLWMAVKMLVTKHSSGSVYSEYFHTDVS